MAWLSKKEPSTTIQNQNRPLKLLVGTYPSNHNKMQALWQTEFNTTLSSLNELSSIEKENRKKNTKHWLPIRIIPMQR